MLTTAEDRFHIELSHYAFEYMSRAKDIGQAVQELLGVVAKKYDLNRITILENKTNLSYLSVTYEWCAEGVKSLLNHVISYTEKLYHYFLGKSEDKGQSETEHSIHYPIFDCITQILKENEDTSLVALPLLLKEKRIGIITFESKGNGNFTDGAVKSFQELKNILESYFFVLRAFKETSEELEQVTRYDSVTGLFNYDTFLKEAEYLMRKADENSGYALIYADIVNFKYFNESYGYSSGDELLKLFNQSISSVCGKKVLACRVFSDYFVILGKLGNEDAEKKLSRVLELLDQNFSDKVKKIYPDAMLHIAAGVYIINDTKQAIKTYIDNADKARKNAKLCSKLYVIYNETMDIEIKRNIMISNIAEDALQNNEFYFELQPKYDLRYKTVIGAEALVRWKRADGTVMYPNEFIPVFEKNEFIVKLDFYVYAKVCQYLREKIDSMEKTVPISMNVSRVHLRYHDFVKRVTSLVDIYGIPHDLLEFEITESIFLDNSSLARNVMVELKEAGFLVSMDDFGAGYSSLNLLKNLDFDILKLDKDFLEGGKIHKKEEIVIESIISMAKKMRIKVLCEGVETKEQAELLEQLKCDLVQGYYFGRPMLAKDFEKLLRLGCING